MAIALSVAFTASPLAAGQKLLIECSPQLSPGVSYINPAKFRSIFTGAAATATPANILANYNAKFGALISGKKIFIRATVLTVDGQRSAPLISSVVVT